VFFQSIGFKMLGHFVLTFFLFLHFASCCCNLIWHTCHRPRVFMSKLHRQRNVIPISSLFPAISCKISFLFFPQITGSQYSLVADDRNNRLKRHTITWLILYIVNHKYILPCKRASSYMRPDGNKFLKCLHPRPINFW
jgi:hypothetical protein